VSYPELALKILNLKLMNMLLYSVIKFCFKVRIMYDFDPLIDRYSSHSSKWHKYSQNQDIIPMWVADMDFPAMPEIKTALANLVEHGIYGYTRQHHLLKKDIVNYVAREYAWNIEVDDIIWLQGLVPGLNLACRSLTTPQDSIATVTPIYPPFIKSINFAQRQLISLPLIESELNWHWDFNYFEQQLQQNLINNTPIKLLLLCNPHNPVGRVWTKAELLKLLDLAIRYDFLVCSDEIHCDLILDSQTQHVPFASLSAEAASRTITLMSASKTYNLAGLNCAYIIASNPQHRQQINAILQGLSSEPNIFGLAALEVALNQGKNWHKQLIIYLQKNLELIQYHIKNWQGFKLIPPQATYLAWLDGRKFMQEYQITNLQHFFEQAGVGLSDGNDFGLDGFVRINFASPQIIIQQALQRMERAITKKINL
jgi:cystathionine beta-lyase